METELTAGNQSHRLPSTGAYGPGSGLTPSHPSRLPFTFSQVHWETTIRETHASGCGTARVGRACLGETQPLTQESVNCCG